MRKKDQVPSNFNFKFHGEDITFVILMAPILTFIILFIFIGLFIALNSLIIRVILILLFLVIIRYFRNNSIRNVYFYEDKILIKFIFGNLKQLEYIDVLGINKQREGFLPIYIYKFNIRKTASIKKGYFNCPDSEIKLLAEFLSKKNIKIS